MLPELIERRVGLVVAIAAVAVFILFLLIAPGFYPSFDEWKYFGIGYNIWDGRGMTTVFGGLFLLHGPIWPMAVTAPHVFLGWDSASWGRLLDGVCGAAIVALAGWFGWRVRPAAGAIAAVAMVGMLYLHDQSRTARLDVPAAAFTMLYLALAFEALRRGSSRWGIVAGAVFAIGFLIKEIGLPFAPIPFLAALLWDRSWRVIARVLGWTLLVASIGLSWWFALFAIESGKVYRAETPAWTLIPITIAIVGLVAVGLGADRLALTDRVRRFTASERWPRMDRSGRLALAIGGTALWAGGQLFAYSKVSRLKGGPILSASQLDLYADQWITPYWFAVLPAAIGLGLSVIAYIAYRRRREREPMTDLWIAAACGAPLVVLVVGVGEAPRNYLVQIALAAPLVGVGLLWAADWFLAERRAWLTVGLGTIVGAVAAYTAARKLDIEPVIVVTAAGALAGFAVGWLPILGPRAGEDRWKWSRPLAMTGMLVLSLIVATGALGAHALEARPNASGPARDAAIGTVDAWVRENVEPGTRLAFGSFLGYEMALTLSDDYEVFHARHGNVSSLVTAPDVIRRGGERPMDDWISIDTAPRNINEFQAFRAGWLQRDLVKRDVGYWIYTVGTDTSAHTILAAITPEHGFSQVEHWAFPIGTTGRSLETYVFTFDAARVQFDPNVMYFSPEALDRMLDLLERDPAAARDAARRLEPQVVITPPSDGDAALLDRLRALAGE